MCKEISKHEIFFSFSLSANFSLPGRVIMRNHFSSSVSWCVISRFLVPGAEMVTWSHCGDPDFLARLSTSTSRLLPTRGEKNGKLDTDKIYKIIFVHRQISVIFIHYFLLKRPIFLSEFWRNIQARSVSSVRSRSGTEPGVTRVTEPGYQFRDPRPRSQTSDKWLTGARSQTPDKWLTAAISAGTQRTQRTQ